MSRRVLDAIVVVLIAAAGISAAAAPAWADEEGETHEGYLLVQQALGHLAHDTSREGVMAAMEKVDDALATDDQDGVNLAELSQAQQLLESGRVDDGRELLGRSISEALAALPQARGEETGTRLVASELPGREGLTARDGGLLVASLLLLVVGGALIFRYRPPDTVRALRRQLAPAGDEGQQRSHQNAAPPKEDQ